MQAIRPFLAVLLARVSLAERTNPLSKVLDLMDDLTATLNKQGDAESKAYQRYFDWCDDVTKTSGFDIKSSAAKKEKLEAQIAEFAASIDASVTRIAKLASAISTDGSELKNATALRRKEVAEFRSDEAELMDVVDTLGRALSIISKELEKNPAAFAQLNLNGAKTIVQALGAVVDAASFAGIDKQKLIALVQSQDEDLDYDSLQAPEAAAYKSQSSGIVDVLGDMKDKAEGSLSDLRESEAKAKHDFEMTKQALTFQIAADTKDMNDEKAAKAEAQEGKATAQGDLEVVVKDLKAAKEELEEFKNTCMQTAADHEASMRARDAELKMIGQAIKILKETSGGAEKQTYSMLQVASTSTLTRARLAGTHALQFVRDLAKEHHSIALSQLASRIAAAVRYSDPFGKVKGLIEGLISKLEKEASDEAAEKAFCDEELSKTSAKQEELGDDISKLTAKIDQASSKSSTLTEEIKELEAALAALTKSQAEMEKMRQESHANFIQAKSELEKGLAGVHGALNLLRDYYASDDTTFLQQPDAPESHKKSGAGPQIIGILEVVESDFATALAKEEAEEEDAQSEFEATTQENKVTKAMKDQDLKYKSAEVKTLGTTVAELSADRETGDSELAAVSEYYAKLKERCVAKPESYEERQARRLTEIKGLKEALSILENEAAFMQRKKHGQMRGTLESQ